MMPITLTKLTGDHMKNIVKGLSGFAFIVSGVASAEVPAAVTTALTDAATDGAAVATLGLLVVIAIAAIKYLRGAK